jgi:hypothetical protein
MKRQTKAYYNISNEKKTKDTNHGYNNLKEKQTKASI